MTREEQQIKLDRMRYTKNTLSSGMVLLAIVFNALYFVSLYKSDVGSYYYNWTIGASIIYNLVFMLVAFLASEGVKSRRSGFTGILLFLGAMQFARIFYLPAKAHAAVVSISGQEVAVMGDGQYGFMVVCLAVSGVLCLAAAVTSSIQNRKLAAHLRSMEKSA